MKTLLRITLATVLTTSIASFASASIEYDQMITPDVIFGSGNANGFWTTSRNNGFEIGLRAKLRHNASGLPENTFNSDGQGNYLFNPGVPSGQAFPTAEWSFEWSINTDYEDTGAALRKLGDFDYRLSMSSTTGAEIAEFDMITTFDQSNNLVLWDHAMGDNSTGNGGGEVASSIAEYQDFLFEKNVAQNSWKPHWFASNFDPTETGIYTFTLGVYSFAGELEAETTINVIVGAIPEPTSALIWCGGLAGLAFCSRRRR